MYSPFVDFLGVSSALEELAEHHNDKEEYGKGAILEALAKQLGIYNDAIQYVEDLVTADNAESRELVINKMTEWVKPWRFEPKTVSV